MLLITGSQKYVNCVLKWLAMLFCHSTSGWYTCLCGTAQLFSEIICAGRISILAFQHAYDWLQQLHLQDLQASSFL